MIKMYFSLLRFIKKKMYNRHVSLGDLIFSRHNTAQFNKFGKGTTCYSNVLVLGDVQVGENCWIGPNTVLDGSGGLIIGNNCTVSAGVQIYTHDSIQGIERKATYIGDNVYIGPNSIIQKGVFIGKNVVIGALSFVNKNIPENGKWLGTSQKIEQHDIH